MAQRAAKPFEELMRGRVEDISGARAAERPADQLRLAGSSAKVDAARLLMRRNLSQLIERAGAGEEIALSVLAKFRFEAHHLGELYGAELP